MESSSTAGDPVTCRPAGGTELSWCRAVPGGTGITVLAILLSRSLSLPLLRSSLSRLQLSHPMLRGRLPSATAASASTPPPILISPTPSEEIELIPSNLLPPLAVDGGTPPVSLFHAVLEHEMNRNPWAGPDEGKSVGSFFASVYELHESGWSVVALRFHTGVCDRISGVAVLKELMNLISIGEADREGIEDAEEGKEGEIGLAIEDLIKKEDAWKPFWVRGKDLIGYSLNGLRSSSLRFEDAGSARKSEFVRLVMDAATTRRLLAACHVKEIKLCAALTAAVFLATYASKNLQKNQAETYSVITLVDCRQYLNPPLNEKHIGFYHSGILNTHTVHGEGFWDVAIRCHRAYSNAKMNKKHLSDIGELNYLMCKAIENPHLTPASSLRTALISVFEEQVDYAQIEQLKGLGVEDFLGCASVHGVGASIALFDTIRNGQLDCVCVYPSPLHSRKQMEELVENMKRILMENCCIVDEGGN